jgi:hypothetical protein
VLAVCGVAGLVALSDVTTVVNGSAGGLVRLSWRAVGERIEKCRVPSEEELAALPPHMRQKEICEGNLAPFALEVHLDGERVVDREVRPAGAREDRPTYVFEEIPVAPGPHDLEVVFAVAEGEAGTGVSPLRLRTTLEVSPRGVVLVTRDHASGDLVLR